MTCTKAKQMRGGGLMCPCHGLHRTASKQLSTTPRAKRSRVRASASYTPAQRSAAIKGAWANEGDEIAAGLVAVLERIRAHQLANAFN